jgi:hypothetical protein
MFVKTLEGKIREIAGIIKTRVHGGLLYVVFKEKESSLDVL